MSRKRSIVDVRPATIAVSLMILVAMSEARPSSTFTGRERTNVSSEDSIDHEIRKLEILRREIVDSSPRGREYGRGASSTVGQTAVRHPRRNAMTSAMYEALAKLANVQIAEPGVFDSSTGLSSDDEKEDDARGSTTGRTVRDPVDEDEPNDARATFGLTRTLKTETATDKSSTVPSKLRFVPRKFRCRPITEIYIPNVDVKMPAYACTLGKRAFVISSERFIQDSRDYFEVNVDESTYKRLIPMTSAMTSMTSGVSVLPATLVLKHGEDGYAVRGFDANWKNLQAAAIGVN